jgi:hypothetical protein
MAPVFRAVARNKMSTKVDGSAVFLFIELCVRSRGWLKLYLEFAQVTLCFGMWTVWFNLSLPTKLSTKSLDSCESDSRLFKCFLISVALWMSH